MNDNILIEMRGIWRNFAAGEETISVLKNINLKINAGEMLAIIGTSGSGKSTLMNILGCLDKASAGDYFINKKDVAKMSPDELAGLRREYFGFVFQRYQLLAGLTAVENVEIPAIYAGISAKERKKRAIELLEMLGLGERINHRPAQLSGGQQQRVSIARALMNGGSIVLADEPTGALDSHTGEQVMQLLQDLNKNGHTIIIVTHDKKVASHANRIIEISDGEIIKDYYI